MLFTGRPEIGKSSLLGAFVRRGYAMLADDVVGVVLDAAGRAVALPAFPSMKLWADTLQALAWQGQERVRPELEKYIRAVPRRAVGDARRLRSGGPRPGRHRGEAGAGRRHLPVALEIHPPQEGRARARAVAGILAYRRRDGEGCAGGARGEGPPTRSGSTRWRTGSMSTCGKGGTASRPPGAGGLNRAGHRPRSCESVHDFVSDETTRPGYREPSHLRDQGTGPRKTRRDPGATIPERLLSGMLPALLRPGGLQDLAAALETCWRGRGWPASTDAASR